MSVCEGILPFPEGVSPETEPDTELDHWKVVPGILADRVTDEVESPEQMV